MDAARLVAAARTRCYISISLSSWLSARTCAKTLLRLGLLFYAAEKRAATGIYVLNLAALGTDTHVRASARNRIKSFSKGNLSDRENLCASEEVRAAFICGVFFQSGHM